MLSVAISSGLREFELEVDFRSSPATAWRSSGPPGPARAPCCGSIAGLHRPDHGRVGLAGRTWLDADARDRPAHRSARSCGYLFQDYALFPHLSAWRNVAFALKRSAPRRAPRRAPRPCSTASGSAPWPTRRRRASPAASASGSPSPGRSPAAPPCSCSTSRWPRSTRGPPRPRPGSWPRRSPRRRSRPSSSPTTSGRRRCSPTTIAVIDRGQVVQRGTRRRAERQAGVRVRRRLHRRHGRLPASPGPATAG